MGDCGTGKWGDIPVDATTVYVDASYVGNDSDGTEAKPFTTIQAAVNAASDGAIVAIAAGSYTEDVALGAGPKRLWGVCAEQVTLTATGQLGGAINVVNLAGGSEIHGLRITGNAHGIYAFRDVLVEGVATVDTLAAGLLVNGSEGQVQVTVRDSLFEGARDATNGEGIYLYNVDALLERVEVRHNLAHGVLALGTVDTRASLRIVDSVLRSGPDEASILGAAYFGRRTDVRIERSFVEATFGRAAVSVEGADADIVQSTIVGGRVFGLQGIDGHGRIDRTSIHHGVAPVGDVTYAAAWASVDAPARLTVTDSTIAEARDYGLVALRTSNTLSGVRVHDTVKALSPEGGPMSVYIEDAPETVIDGLDVDGGVGCGLGAWGSTVSLTRGAIRDIGPEPTGRGYGVWTTGCDITLLDTTVDDVVDTGIRVSRGRLDVDNVRVQSVSPNASTAQLGRGVMMSDTTDVNQLSRLTVSGAQDTGVAVYGAEAWLDRSLVEDIRANPDGTFGDGIVCTAGAEGGPRGRIAVSNTTVRGVDRVAVAAFDAEVALSDTTLLCNLIDLSGDAVSPEGFTIEDEGGNVCGCDVETTCKIETATPQLPSMQPASDRGTFEIADPDP